MHHGGVGSQLVKGQLGVWNILPDEYTTFQLTEYFDFIYLDLEHGLRPINDLLRIIAIYNLKSTNYSVRVRSFDDNLIQTLLDAGVRNFILPQIRTLGELEIFKNNINFPPLGARGFHPKSNLKINSALSETVSITVIVETPEALQIIDEIASEPLVTDLYLGVFDLSMALQVEGGPYSSELDSFYLKVKDVCRLYQKNFVAMLPSGADLSFATKHSLDKCVVGIDAILLDTYFLELTQNLRASQHG